ncbi:TPT-domain-containing protein [Fomitiporia mediterranea MF3/22]|uniref:TPT-domain-containing protein n=1 Tax=Fomitiporia mediterranea (strain MF3/22) TaxID=694068 RepID=UPI00044075B1|nr:TPT-domain-containing protein [Fomitiporia mediterranea MF3/22]EJD01752.1 TPT-domain-containing protein [Fomitiporia mediterranea MF3/22]
MSSSPFSSFSKSELSEHLDIEQENSGNNNRNARHPRPSSSSFSLSSSSTSTSQSSTTAKLFSGSQLSWLILYFFSNLSLTLYNKFVLVRFPFPYTLTALHALCGTLGGYILMERGVFEPRALSSSENVVLVAFSVLYTVNIAVSNLSLGLVTVPFHQVVRAATPIFVMAISYLFLNTRFSARKLWTLLPVMAGVGFATFGDYYFTTWGLLLTLLGTFLAALKTVFTNVLQSPLPNSNDSSSSSNTSDGGHSSSPSSSSNSSYTHHRAPSIGQPTRPHPLSRIRLHLHPLDLLSRMSPLAFVQCVFVALLSGELERVRVASAREMGWGRALALMTNGMLAFMLNVVSFTANKKVGALSMTVAANVKQVLTILFAVFLFDLTITPVNALGIILTLVGGAWYASVEYQERQQKRRNQSLKTSAGS